MTHHSLFKSIFHQEISDPTSQEMLEQVKKDSPYFSAAHYFLLKKISESDVNYDNTAALTALHFGNPFLLNYHLAKKENTLDELTEAPAGSVHSKSDIKEKVEEAVVSTTVTSLSTSTMADDKSSEELVFEPLYTTDYFASQGIKLSEEIQSSDKLGKQLKSFTEWLKTMKKVHDSKLPEGNEQLDSAVQHLAEKSNKEDEIITEAMAHAYEQQGKTTKAIEIYQKLSLLNPLKSAFFAAKIDQLNNK